LLVTVEQPTVARARKMCLYVGKADARRRLSLRGYPTYRWQMLANFH
jgi:hypothetical protein